jgi:hypothetical protein
VSLRKPRLFIFTSNITSNIFNQLLLARAPNKLFYNLAITSFLLQ